MKIYHNTVLFLFIVGNMFFAQSGEIKTIRVHIDYTLKQLIDEEDTDKDRKITVDDFPIMDTGKGDGRFRLDECLLSGRIISALGRMETIPPKSDPAGVAGF